MRDIYMLKGHRLRQQHCFSKSCYSMPRDLEENTSTNAVRMTADCILLLCCSTSCDIASKVPEIHCDCKASGDANDGKAICTTIAGCDEHVKVSEACMPLVGALGA